MIDNYGRTVNISTVGSDDVYTVVGTGIIVSYPTGTPQYQALNTINGMAPAGWTATAEQTQVAMNTGFGDTYMISVDTTGNLIAEGPV